MVEFLAKIGGPLELIPLPSSLVKNLLKYKDSKNWHYRFYDQQGKRRTISLGTDDEAEAILKARAFDARAVIQRVENISLRTIGIQNIIDKYLLAAATRRRNPMGKEAANTAGTILKRFCLEANVVAPQEITPARLDTWLAAYEKKGRSQQTVRMYAAYVKTFVHWLYKTGKLGINALESYDLPEGKPIGRKNWLRKAEVSKVIKAVEPKHSANAEPPTIEKARQAAQDLKFILYCGFHAGLRRREITMAKVSWFDLDHGLIHAQNMPEEGYTLKDEDNRTIDMSDEFKVFLTEYLKHRDSKEFVLRPTKIQGAWKYRYDFSRMVEGHFESVGVKCSIHDMRRSFASNAVSSGISLYIVSKWLGDGYEVIEKSYGHLAPNTGEINKVVR
jgi:integrase